MARDAQPWPGRVLVEQIAEAGESAGHAGGTDGRAKLVETIPGGPALARRCRHLGDAERFATAKQVGALRRSGAAAVPSGVTVGKDHRAGRQHCRSYWSSAWGHLRYNPWACDLYRRLTGGGNARKKPAVVALARKLLVRCWAMLRDGVPWRADPEAGTDAVRRMSDNLLSPNA